MRNHGRSYVAGIFLFLISLASSVAQVPPIRVAIAGLVHGHAQRLFDELPAHPDIQLVGIVEQNHDAAEKYISRYHLDRKLFFPTLDQLIEAQHPKIVLGYTSIADHRQVIETAARHGVDSMAEKPLTVSLEDALAIRAAARAHHVRVMVNYETTWYASNKEALAIAQAGRIGPVRRILVNDGHNGPVAIHVGPEFLAWLTDANQNGAGAMYDFGCYGADLVTELMHGQPPTSVTAIANLDQPGVYPRAADDDATIVLRYPGAQAVLQASWNWPFERKDMAIYGATGYVDTVGLDGLKTRFAGQKEETTALATPMPPAERSSLSYLVAVERGQIEPEGDLSSLPINMVVMQILDAARTSVRTGKAVVLTPLPE